MINDRTRHIHIDSFFLSFVLFLSSADMYTIADISIWPWMYQLYDRYDNAATVSHHYIPSHPIQPHIDVELLNQSTNPLIHLFTYSLLLLLQEVFEDLKRFPLLREWFHRCVSRQASKNSLTVCPFVVST